MKYYATETSFKNPWEETIVAVWRRYPNPFSKHVIAEDTIERRVDGARLFTKRILLKTNPLPKWGQRLVSTRQVALVEESVLDRDQRTFVTYTRNIGYTSTMNVIEKCIYVPSTSDHHIFNDGGLLSSTTLLKREAWISSKLRGFASVLQRFAVERYKHNSLNASKGLAHVLMGLFPPHHHSSTITTATPAFQNAAAKLSTSAHAVTDLVVHKIENAAAAKSVASSASSM